MTYFAGLGKAAFLNAFYQYSDFITGNKQEGSLSDNSSESEIKGGFLLFVRLIGTLYFKKHLSAFVALRCVQHQSSYLTLLLGTQLRRNINYGMETYKGLSVIESAVKRSECPPIHHALAQIMLGSTNVETHPREMRCPSWGGRRVVLETTNLTGTVPSFKQQYKKQSTFCEGSTTTYNFVRDFEIT